MKRTARLWFLAIIFFCTGVPHSYSQAYPGAEGYIGFTVLNNEYGAGRQNSPGVQLGLGYNLRRNLRLVADFGAQTHGTRIVWTNGRSASANSYQLLFGPELTLRKSERITPFVHGLAGVAFRSYAVPTGKWACNFDSCYETSFSVARDTGFATAVGGGVDWSFHQVLAFRIAQLDWIHTNLSRDNPVFSPIQAQLPTLQGWQNNYRFSCGITFRFGSKGVGR